MSDRRSRGPGPITRRPHATFFTYLNSFGTVTSLTLERCRFRQAEVIPNIVGALPSLRKLALLSITVHSAPQALNSIGESLLPSAKRKLRSLMLFGSSVPSPTSNTYTVGTPEWELPSDEAIFKTVVKDMKAFTNVTLVWVSSAFATLFFKLFAKQCCELRILYIGLVDVPGPEFQAAIDKVLQQSGAVLHTFRCEYKHREQRTKLGISTPSLVYNTALEHLDVTITVASLLRTSRIYKTLLSLFTQLRSPCLKHMSMQFFLQKPGDVRPGHCRPRHRYGDRFLGHRHLPRCDLSRDIF
ncbi:uncharacterized protein B0H18DRAFT_958205 [Fomitopsis serialis]|uniref:uncharacterized protein n=1 Tax=Fomitopsis serialis TaxID=139415 RepID=UPI0020080F91|nr:uncharacterized protein B0H18DRAFT_958205 [Neoantrodia serialis]KAH9917766.1 hypothetical protein B0H18DRAFT_958205 [Neoantrodia serialis]